MRNITSFLQKPPTYLTKTVGNILQTGVMLSSIILLLLVAQRIWHNIK